MRYEDTKQGGDFGVDKNGVPVGFRWRVLRKVFDDEDKIVIENTVYVPFTDEELQAHVAAALTARDADIAQDRAEKDALMAQLAAEAKKAEDRKTVLADLKAQVEAALSE